MQRKPTRKAQNQPIAPAPRRTAKAAPTLPTSGFVLVVDGQMKGEFNTKDAARARGQDLKRRYPALQVKVFDAQEKRSEDVELAET